MDLKSDDYHTKIDPSGIDMSGDGNNIILDVESGRVGIGTNDPKASLHVDNDFHIAANSGSWNATAGKGLYFRYSESGGQDAGYIQCINRATEVRYPLKFSAASFTFTEGDFGIGNTAPASLLHIGTDGDGTDQMITIAAPSGHTSNSPLILGGAVSAATNSAGQIRCSSNLHIDCPDGGGLFLNHYEQGNIFAVGSLHVSSDRRIKTNIETVDDNEALDIVNQLETKQYNYIDKTTEKKRIGFIAQEVKAVLPDAVSLITMMVPNIYTTYNCIIEVISNNLYKINILEWPNGEENSTYKLIFNKGTSDKFSINGEYKNGCFELEITTEKFNINITTIFIYGKEVNDFHTIDKNQIFALHHSAIQELSRRNDTLVAENTAKTAEISELKNEISLIKQHLGI
uniref:Peptidase S74 domain-containing protein n=1 Tax=viral metagenome TaxID=1070528 RepID=A0A6C0BWG2_9ZZZZ